MIEVSGVMLYLLWSGFTTPRITNNTRAGMFVFLFAYLFDLALVVEVVCLMFQNQINAFCRYVYTKLLAVLGKARRPDDALQIFNLMCVSNLMIT